MALSCQVSSSRQRWPSQLYYQHWALLLFIKLARYRNNQLGVHQDCRMNLVKQIPSQNLGFNFYFAIVCIPQLATQSQLLVVVEQMEVLKLYLCGMTLLHYLQQNAVKVKVHLTIANPITSNNFCNSLENLRVGYSNPQEDTLYASPIITSIMQYSQAAPSFPFHLYILLAPLPASEECFSFISV